MRLLAAAVLSGAENSRNRVFSLFSAWRKSVEATEMGLTCGGIESVDVIGVSSGSSLSLFQYRNALPDSRSVLECLAFSGV